MADQKPFFCRYTELPMSYERHTHNVHEMLYIASGNVRVQIGSVSYDGEAGDLFVISRLEEHSTVLGSGFYRRYTLQLTGAWLDHTLEDARLKSLFLRRPAGFCHRLSDTGRELEPYFRFMAEEEESAPAFVGISQAALFCRMMVLCYRQNPERFPLPATTPAGPVLEAQRYIDAHFMEDLTLDDLARHAYLSPSYLSHAFREWTGSSPKQYILLSRIALARELLSSTDLSVAAVASRCGFGDVSNFIRSFKKETGTTPGQYRRSGE